MTDMEQCQAADNAAFDAMQRAGLQAASALEASVRRLVAMNKLDQYHEMIEAMGWQYSPNVWKAFNPLDKRHVT